MDLAQIGAHCSLPSCNILDFLPIVCQCKAYFCSQHISPDLHACRTVHVNITSTTSTPLQRCTLDGCQKPSLPIYNEPSCSTCYESFCADHRHPEMHNCQSQLIVPTPPKSQSSAALRKPLRIRSTKPPTDPTKLLQWQKMDAMKTRHQAVCGDPKDKTASPPADQRLHVKIRHQNADKVFWFRKNVVTGRALDLLVIQLGLTFEENKQPIKLCTTPCGEEEIIYLQNDQLLASQVKDGSALSICSVE